MITIELEILSEMMVTLNLNTEILKKLITVKKNLHNILTKIHPFRTLCSSFNRNEINQFNYSVY